jgi:hypothetical protein
MGDCLSGINLDHDGWLTLRPCVSGNDSGRQLYLVM